MFIAANWKMNLNKTEIHDFVKGISDFKFNDKVKACIFPSSINIDYLLYLLLTPPPYFQRFSLEKNLFLPPFALFFIQQLLFIKTGT